MQRYLLFDSGCAVCTRLADDIERASDGWLHARSLRDPDVKTLLDAAKPGWRWEPTLLEVTDGQPRVFTGVPMRARMALGLGPRRAWQMAALVQQNTITLVHKPTARRKFLQRGGLATIGLIFGAGFGDTAGAKAAKQSPYNIVRVDAADAVIPQLKSSSAVEALNGQFGNPNWQEAYRITYEDTGKVGYLVMLQSAANNSSSSVTFLTFGDPASELDTKGIVGQITPRGKEVRFDWFLPNASPMGSLQTQEGELVQDTKGATTSQFDVPCFLACVGITLSAFCLTICTSCAAVPFPANPACITCVGCAGAAALGCILVCL